MNSNEKRMTKISRIVDHIIMIIMGALLLIIAGWMLIASIIAHEWNAVGRLSAILPEIR